MIQAEPLALRVHQIEPLGPTLRRLTLGRLGTEPLLVVVQDLDADGSRAPIEPGKVIDSLHL